MSNVMAIGKGKKPWITLPRSEGLYYSALDMKEELERRKSSKKK